jgi:hypothetical protein
MSLPDVIVSEATPTTDVIPALEALVAFKACPPEILTTFPRS